MGFPKTLQSGRLPHTGEPEHASGWPCAAPGGVGRGRGLEESGLTLKEKPANANCVLN